MLQVPNPLLKHVPNQTSLPTGIMMCANCDSPDGITPPPDPDEDEVTERDLGGK